MDRVNLQIYPSVFLNQSRMIRIGDTLEKMDLFDKIIFVATEDEGLPSEKVLSARQSVVRLGPSKRGLSKLFHIIAWSRNVYRFGVQAKVTCVSCHSLSMLPVCTMLKWRTGASLVYDTHELESKPAAAGHLRQVAYSVLERFLIPFVDVTFVVNNAISDWYKKAYPGKPVHVIKNYPSLKQSDDTGINIRKSLNIEDGAILFLYQGILGHGRGVHLLLEAFLSERISSDAKKRHLVFMGKGLLAGEIDAIAKESSYIHRIDPVDPAAVLSMTRQADVTLGLVEPISKSYELSLPNKLLESLASGVPMLASDLPEYRREMEDGKYGWLIHPDVEALVREIISIDADAIARKKKDLEGWWTEHNWETQEEDMVLWYRKYAKN